MTEQISWRPTLDYSAIAVVAVLATSVSGQFATFPNLAPWYAALIKPSFDPPNWLFGPVWSTLYLLMAFAVWRIARLPVSSGRTVALVLFFTQLALNAAWPWMFFAAHSPQLGLVNVVPQFLSLVATAIAFARLEWMAAAALVPLAAWVGFASVLNYAIWQLNS